MNINEKRPDIWVKEFSIDADPYFPEREYIVVSSNPDEEKLESFIDYFYNHNGTIHTLDDMFIIPKAVFSTVLAPTFNYVYNLTKERGDN